MAPLNSPFDDSLRPPLLSVALISAAAVGYEVLLLRLFSIIQWHHFAYMIISLALLGYGVSGTFLALAGEQVGRRFRDLFALNAALFGAAAPGCFFLAQRVPLNPLELLWDPLQPLYLALLYLLLAVPFLFAANCIGLTLYRFRRLMGRTYGSDLLGAGTGALGMVGLLFWLAPVDALKALGAAGFAAAALSLVTSPPLAGETAFSGGRAASVPVYRSLYRTQAFSLQRTKPGASGFRGQDRRRTFRPAGPVDGGGKPQDSLPPRPGA